MSEAFLNIESQPGRLIVSVKGQWIFDQVLALEVREVSQRVLAGPTGNECHTPRARGLDLLEASDSHKEMSKRVPRVHVHEEIHLADMKISLSFSLYRQGVNYFITDILC